MSTTKVPAGPVTFTVKNESSTAITEVELLQDQRIFGEKENLAPGLAAVSFTSTLGGGKYQVYCPGADTELTDFTVTGKVASTANSSAATLLKQGATGYADYVDAQVSDMVTAVKQLQTHVEAGDLDAAKQDYAEARPYYEHVESDVDGFVKKGHKATDNAGNLDYLIDMRASNLDPAVGWSGFHAVERDLFANGAITDDTKKTAADLTDERRTAREARPDARLPARGPGERRRRAARRGAVEQDLGRGRGVQPHRPGRPRRERRGRPAGLRLPQAGPDEARPDPDEADQHAVRRRRTR